MKRERGWGEREGEEREGGEWRLKSSLLKNWTIEERRLNRNNRSQRPDDQISNNWATNHEPALPTHKHTHTHTHTHTHLHTYKHTQILFNTLFMLDIDAEYVLMSCWQLKANLSQIFLFWTHVKFVGLFVTFYQIWHWGIGGCAGCMWCVSIHQYKRIILHSSFIALQLLIYRIVYKDGWIRSDDWNMKIGS